jgi:dihydrofolate reductase
MGKVSFAISMSLDGFITAAHQTAEEPMGTGGLRLHEWAMGDDPANHEFMGGKLQSLGAVITGRRNYDHSVPSWQADGPTGPARRPVFVVTHEAPKDSPDGGVYTFVTGGIKDALAEAQATAAGKDVTIMGGAEVGRQYIEAGLVDEIAISLVPVLFGNGTRMFGDFDKHIQLEPLEVVPTKDATHLIYKIVK